jgi:hypothetical protein
VTSARLAKLRLQQEQEFLDVCEEYEERLETAKQAVKDARASGDQDAIAEARAALKPVKAEFFEFRSWARSVGRPRDGVPGKDATVRMGGAVDGVGR